MKTVFVDTSGFYACLDGSDAFHPQALAAFERAEQKRWELVTTNYGYGVGSWFLQLFRKAVSVPSDIPRRVLQ